MVLIFLYKVDSNKTVYKFEGKFIFMKYGTIKNHTF